MICHLCQKNSHHISTFVKNISFFFLKMFTLESISNQIFSFLTQNINKTGIFCHK